MASPELTVLGGDARVAADLAKALTGQEAVLSALGTMKAGDEPLKRSTAGLVRAAPDAGVRRIVLMSSVLAAPNYEPNLAGKLAAPMMKGMLADKNAGEELLTRSDLDWTIVYATSLDKARAGQPVRVVGPQDKGRDHHQVGLPDSRPGLAGSGQPAGGKTSSPALSGGRWRTCEFNARAQAGPSWPRASGR